MRGLTIAMLAIGLAGAPPGAPASAAALQTPTTVSVAPAAPAPTVEAIPIADHRQIARRWGVAIESLRLTASGFMLDFRYRVVDARKAKPLFERKLKPVLRDESTGAVMAVPVPPKTGALRNSNDPKAGRSYFMFFANPARFIKPGSRVSVSIGAFSVTGLLVESETASLPHQGVPDHTGHASHAQSRRTVEPSVVAARPVAVQSRLEDIVLVDQQDRALSLADAVAAEGPVLVNFIFTSCTTICPVMSAGFSQLQARLGDDAARVRLVSISIDPEHDTTAALREYARRYQATGAWFFLTGSEASVEAAQRAFGALRGGKANHTPLTFVRRSRNDPWLAIEGLVNVETLLRAYRGTLSVEAPF